MYSPVIVQLYN